MVREAVSSNSHSRQRARPCRRCRWRVDAAARALTCASSYRLSLSQDLTEYAKQLGAFVILVVVQATAILLFKLCQQDGKYTFNPASSVALTEMCKLVLAFTLHYQFVQSSKKPFWEHVTPRIVVHYLGLSTLYTINNQLSFYCLELADPGSMALGEAIASRRP